MGPRVGHALQRQVNVGDAQPVEQAREQVLLDRMTRPGLDEPDRVVEVADQGPVGAKLGLQQSCVLQIRALLRRTARTSVGWSMAISAASLAVGVSWPEAWSTLIVVAPALVSGGPEPVRAGSGPSHRRGWSSPSTS